MTLECDDTPLSESPEPLEPRLEKQPGRCWFPVFAKPNKEKALFDFMQRTGIHGYLPLRPKIRTWHGRRLTSLLPMFRGYVFVCTNADETRRLRYGSDYILRTFLLPPEQEEQLLEELRAVRRFECLSADTRIEIKPEIVPGRQVHILKGPLEGLCGIVTRRQRNQKITVNLPLLGCSCAIVDVVDLELA